MERDCWRVPSEVSILLLLGWGGEEYTILGRLVVG